jgi:hypothetical protein
MVHLPPQVEKICQKIDAFMVKYPSLTQYGASMNRTRIHSLQDPSVEFRSCNTGATCGKFCHLRDAVLLSAQEVHDDTCDSL